MRIRKLFQKRAPLRYVMFGDSSLPSSGVYSYVWQDRQWWRFCKRLKLSDLAAAAAIGTLLLTAWIALG